jgi:cysteinyl-tRNA synthetase
VRQIINITDVGHLVSDDDEGEDKMEVGARREGKRAKDIATEYAKAFMDDLSLLNIKTAEAYPKATEHIPEQIVLIEELERKGFTYIISDGVYFDTAKFPDYGKMARLDIAGQREGARVEANTEKRNPTDFALWKFSPKNGEKREQEWESPWGVGFPGWHIECSAMSMKYLGDTLDIHTGGIDHIPVHHTNEIAQSESATGKQFARFWMHCAHMMVDGQKMSKSLGNIYQLSDLTEKKISPLAFRAWLLTARYSTQINFTLDSVRGLQTWLERIRREIHELGPSMGKPIEEYIGNFCRHMNEDLNTTNALAEVGIVLSLPYKPEDKRATVAKMDEVLGLRLLEWEPEKIVLTPELQKLLDERTKARDEKNFAESDRLRDEIHKLGYVVKDTPDGQRLEPR